VAIVVVVAMLAEAVMIAFPVPTVVTPVMAVVVFVGIVPHLSRRDIVAMPADFAAARRSRRRSGVRCGGRMRTPPVPRRSCGVRAFTPTTLVSIWVIRLAQDRYRNNQKGNRQDEQNLQ
jgi:hypothetical protein